MPTITEEEDGEYELAVALQRQAFHKYETSPFTTAVASTEAGTASLRVGSDGSGGSGGSLGSTASSGGSVGSLLRAAGGAFRDMVLSTTATWGSRSEPDGNHTEDTAVDAMLHEATTAHADKVLSFRVSLNAFVEEARRPRRGNEATWGSCGDADNHTHDPVVDEMLKDALISGIPQRVFMDQQPNRPPAPRTSSEENRATLVALRQRIAPHFPVAAASQGPPPGGDGQAAAPPPPHKSPLLIDLGAVRAGTDLRTTVQIRNIPAQYTREKLVLEIVNTIAGRTFVAALDLTGNMASLGGMIDFFYMPVEWKGKKKDRNNGYAFVNFVSPRCVIPFFERLHGHAWALPDPGKGRRRQVCELRYATKQGKRTLVDSFRGSSVLKKPPKCRPLRFYSSGPNRGRVEPWGRAAGAAAAGSGGRRFVWDERKVLVTIRMHTSRWQRHRNPLTGATSLPVRIERAREVKVICHWFGDQKLGAIRRLHFVEQTSFLAAEWCIEYYDPRVARAAPIAFADPFTIPGQFTIVCCRLKPMR